MCIRDRGDHDTLLAAGGIYREIYDLQFRSQEEAEVMAERSGN